MKNPRALFRPKYPEVSQQCASCPFRYGNEKEFGMIVANVRKLAKIRGKPTLTEVLEARLRVWMQVQQHGEFLCHGTVYGADMEGRPQSEWRQCKGATHSFKTGKFFPEKFAPASARAVASENYASVLSKSGKPDVSVARCRRPRLGNG